jgi:hypothetical protein
MSLICLRIIPCYVHFYVSVDWTSLHFQFGFSLEFLWMSWVFGTLISFVVSQASPVLHAIDYFYQIICELLLWPASKESMFYKLNLWMIQWITYLMAGSWNHGWRQSSLGKGSTTWDIIIGLITIAFLSSSAVVTALNTWTCVGRTELK